ncbi:MAG: calcium-translocating P-type ATPase, PMCA-type [Crocinitomicaceae bacterium]|nr:calcium-translocating P-type ATPase, PMCA-type [Crocinitomicaceae bacterium]|tara:strand:- start:2559 stop:5237 length:2679 start_codon:yes stop_codon:yes gene_type:complete
MIEVVGLSDSEVKESALKNGSNKLTEQDKQTFSDKLLENVKDPMILILIVALVVVVFLSFMGYTEWYEGVGIGVAVALATLVSTYSEFKNEETFQKLQEEASKVFLNVYRGSQLRHININDIVVGDKIFLQPGDKLPADGELINGQIKVNQAMLNGEAEPVKKEVGSANLDDLNDPNSIFRGTIVEDGEGIMHVLRVGDSTQFGKLAQELKTEDRPGPLRLKLTSLANTIAKLGYMGAPLIALAFMFKIIFIDNDGDVSYYFSQEWQLIFADFMQALILAVIIIVVIVPEGLPMMIAIVLAQNMKKLLKNKVLVRQLLGIETSGSLNILFSDKTGTITKGKLDAVAFVLVNEQKEDNLHEFRKLEELPSNVQDDLRLSVQENTSAIVNMKAERKEEIIIGGNSTDRALLKYVKADQIEFSSPVVKHRAQILFNSSRKFSASEVTLKNGTEVSLIKGAAERVLEKCTTYYDIEGAKKELTETRREEISLAMEKKAEQGFRIIGVGTSDQSIAGDYLPDSMTLIGFSLIRDELREEAHDAIVELSNAGIQVVMCTGDRHGTAVAIANEAGLINGKDHLTLRSEDMASMSDEELSEIMPKLSVISRCLPSDKTRLVRIAQSRGLVVGMTGDGVNDSPALSRADVGFALGSGTEVAKEASDIVVLDDNIQSIANAVQYGRTIYRSVQKFITFQLTVNVSAILLAFIGPFLGFELPLTMIQLLWINLIMDTLAALAFSGEPPLDKHMEEAPKSREEGLISKKMWSSILANGLFMTTLCIFFLKSDWVYDLFGWDGVPGSENEVLFQTAFFTLFVFLNNFNKFNVRVEDLGLLDHITKNKGFIRVTMIIFGVQFILAVFGGELFRTTPMNVIEWAWVLFLSFLIIPFDLVRKMIMRNS